MELNVGTKINWVSAAGNLTGTVKKIWLAPAANNEVTPWMIVDIKPTKKQPRGGNVMLCGNAEYLKMMQVQVA